MSRLGGWTTWIIFVLVVGTAATTLLPVDEPGIPGGLRLAVLDGPGAKATENAVQPLCNYLSRALGLNTRPEVVRASEMVLGAGEAQILLGPVELLGELEGYEILAWAKGPGLRAEHEHPFAVYTADSLWMHSDAPRVILGDPWTWSGGSGAEEYLRERGKPLEDAFALRREGRNPYDHSEALASVAHGAFDLALVRESDLKRALEVGLIDPREHRFESAGPPRGGFVLVASSGLAEGTRRQLREAALNLDAYRFDPQHLLAASALSGLRGLGIEGFVPDRIFPSLRP